MELTTNQLAGLVITLFILSTGYLKFYIDAKIDPIAKNMDFLIKYMVEHSEKIAALEERTKKL